MAMSKKHYESIAAIISGVWDQGPDYEGGEAIIVAIAERLASFFKEDNQQFDRSRFLCACGVKE